ncbi:MAG: M23 family metallopeptidase [Oscillospiraceae bacterium]|nr:M23 family metallopeptidase [Oscillospiraceae bacterium]
MKKSTLWQRVGDFVMGKGFYIVLTLCVATIGISGYYLVSVFNSGEEPEPLPVGGGAQVVIPKDEVVQPPIPDQSGVPQLDEHEKEDVKNEEPPAPVQEQQPVAVVVPPVYTWPVKGEIVSNFSLEVLAYDETMGDWRTHSGVDISAQPGTRVLAMSSGTVRRVYEDELMGTTVVIDHGEGLVSYYHNLTASPTVSEGDEVITGTVIGAVGDTAIAESGRPSHLHLEVSLDGRPVDPVDYLPQY